MGALLAGMQWWSRSGRISGWSVHFIWFQNHVCLLNRHSQIRIKTNWPSSKQSIARQDAFGWLVHSWIMAVRSIRTGQFLTPLTCCYLCDYKQCPEFVGILRCICHNSKVRTNIHAGPVSIGALLVAHALRLGRWRRIERKNHIPRDKRQGAAIYQPIVYKLQTQRPRIRKHCGGNWP